MPDLRHKSRPLTRPSGRRAPGQRELATARSPQDGVGARDRIGRRLCGEPFWVRRVEVRLLLKCLLNRGRGQGCGGD